MTQKQFIDSFDFENSEWAQEWMDKNGKINTVEKVFEYLKENFVYPFDYLSEHIENHLIDSE